MIVPEFARLSKVVYVILGLNPGKMTLEGTNCYLVGSGSTRLLIDTGQGIDRFLPHLKECLAKAGCTSLSAILITHRHEDHTLGIPQVFEALNSSIPVFKHMSIGEDPPLFYSCETISEGQVFSVEGASLRAVLSPGHTSDHVSFVLEEEKVEGENAEAEKSLFSGDCVLGAGTAVFENLKIYLESLAKLGSLDIKSHGPVIEDGKKAIADYISHRLKRELQILEVLASDAAKRAWTPMDIVAILYKGYPEELYPAATRGVVLHLGKLEKEGRALQLNGGWSIVVKHNL